MTTTSITRLAALATAALLAWPAAPRAAGAPPPAEAAPAAGPAQVKVVSDAAGWRLTVDGKDFMVVGVNWDYFPIGTNYSYDFWHQPDEVIEAALASEMPLIKRMGANALRLYAGIPPRWVRHLHDRYGLWVVLNHTVGRYGYQLDGTWVPVTDYANPRFRAAVKAEIAALVEQYKGVPGLLMWLYGNENNYGLSWSSFEIEALPAGEREAAKAKHLYSLFGEIIRDTKARDPNHPVAIANGDVQYLDLIAAECQGLDVMGANVYRGTSARDLFDVVKAKLGLPVLFTEFGADAFDAKRGREDDVTQARYLVAQWREIYEQSAGKGKAGNAVGGLIFQWSDGWWKYKQESNLDVHDTNASWPNGGYKEDLVEGQNNMNEEWWGLCAKGQPDERGLYALSPRTAYYALKEAFRLDPYAPGTTPAAIAAHFDGISPDDLAFHYKADQAVARGELQDRVRVSNVLLSFETYSTGGNSRWQRTDAVRLDKDGTEVDLSRGFDHMESAYVDVAVRPTDKVEASVGVNVLGNVARNPIDEIFYERRGKPVQITNQAGEPAWEIKGSERIKIYRAKASWDDPWFKLDAFHRTGHYHWAAEGDLFGLYREANYGANVDVYDADAPSGAEVAFKRQLDGLKVAFGPQLWWGANPAVMAKYRREVGGLTLTLLHQEDLGRSTGGGASSVIPVRPDRKTALALETRLLGAGVELSGLWAGSSKIDRPFLDDQGRLDAVRATDTLGARAKVTWESGTVHAYAQGAFMGLVADAGPDARVTYTGWTLKDSGSGNQVNALAGVAWNLGMFQVGPNFLWQKPLVGPGRSFLPFAGGGTAARNIEADPFSVRANRETLAGELMIVFDPTPGTWMWAWDNDLREDAPLAASLDVAFRHMPTATDATLYIGADGSSRFAFPSGSAAADVWEVSGRVVSAPRHDLRLVLHAFGGNQQANGDNTRQPHRYGGDLRVTWRHLALAGHAKFNDWGPYDYHRDFNLTFPLQLMGDVSWNLGAARWLWVKQTAIGFRATSRWLNGYSPRFVLDKHDPKAWGQEYELRTYLVVTL